MPCAGPRGGGTGAVRFSWAFSVVARAIIEHGRRRSRNAVATGCAMHRGGDRHPWQHPLLPWISVVSTLRSPPILVALVFAEIADLGPTLEVIGTVAALLAAIGAGVWAFVWMRNWRRQLAEEAISDEPIETYQQMLDDGLIDDQEFERIAARLQTGPTPAAPLPLGARLGAPETGVRAGQPPQP